MGYKTSSENSCAVRAPPPANETPPLGAATADSTSKTPPFPFFFVFFKETDLLVALALSTFVGDPTHGARQVTVYLQSAIPGQGRRAMGVLRPQCQAAEGAFLLRAQGQLPTAGLWAPPQKMYSFPSARVGVRKPTSEGLRAQCGTRCRPLGRHSGVHTPRAARASPGRPRRARGENKGDAPALAPGGRRPRPAPSAREMAAAPQNGSRAGRRWRRKGRLAASLSTLRAAAGGLGAPSCRPPPRPAAPPALPCGGGLGSSNRPLPTGLLLWGSKREGAESRTPAAQGAPRPGAGREPPFPRVSTLAALTPDHREDRKGGIKEPTPQMREIKEMGEQPPHQSLGSHARP